METRLFDSCREIEIVVPPGQSLDDVHQAYMSIAVSGSVSDDQRNIIFQAGKKICEDQE